MKSTDTIKALLEENEKLRKQAGECLKRESFYNSILENASSAVALIDEDGQFSLYNTRFLKIFGLSEKSTIRNVNDQDWSEYKVFDEDLKILHVDDHPVRKAALTGKKVEDQLVAVQVPGNADLTWMLISAVPLFNEDGKIVNTICTYQDITSHKKSDELFQLILRNSLDIIYLVNLKTGKYEFLSPSVESMLGFSPGEIKSMDNHDILSMIHPDDITHFEEALELSLKNGSAKAEYRQLTNRGDYRWLSNFMVVIRDQNDEPLYRNGNIRDITGLKNVEVALRESQENYMELVNNARTIILKMDRKGRFTFINEFGIRFFGFSEDEIIGKTATETIVPKVESTGRDMDILVEDIYMDPDKYSVNVNENIRKNGERIWIEWYNKALFDPEGNHSGHMAVGIDITEKRKTQERLNIALENGNIGIWEWNISKDELRWDERMDRMFGLKPGESVRTRKDFENLVNEEDLQHVEKNFRETLETNAPYEAVYRIKATNGGTRYISTKALLNRDGNGNPMNLSGVCFDVTGLREGTEQLVLKLNEELLRSNRDLENFAYVASHDLQEPLRMVTSFTQLLMKQYGNQLDDKAREYISFAVDGSKRMYELLNGLLAYSRINTRGQQFGIVDMGNVIGSVKKNLRLKIEERKAIIKYADLPVVQADENQMTQLFQNLIANAIKFSPGQPVIQISSEKDENKFIFSVRDEGMGIEPQYFDKIFQIFQRLNPRDKFEGTGIGLAICKRIVNRHGGEIWVESEPGKGSTFCFTIPVSGV